MNTRLKKGDNIPFTQVANSVLYHPSLSLKAKGLYCYMLAKPDDWDFSATRISKEIKESRPTILDIIKELIDIGLLKYVKNTNGRSEYTIYAYVEPESKNLTLDSEPESKNATVKECHGQEPLPISNSIPLETNSLYKQSRVNPSSLECENSAETNQRGIDMIFESMDKWRSF